MTPNMPASQKITTFLWFTSEAEQAVRFYTSLFADSRVLSMLRTDGSGPGAKGPVITASFQLAGQTFHALNGRPPNIPFTEATSLFVSCDTQAEIDDLWARLTADGGQESRCGWLKDKFGMSWQIVPTNLGELLGNPDREKAMRAQKALLSMNKLDIRVLQEA